MEINKLNLFSLPDAVLDRIYGSLPTKDYLNLLLAYEGQIPEIISQCRLKSIFGDSFIVQDNLINRGWHYLIKTVSIYETPITLIPNVQDNRYFQRINNTFIPHSSKSPKLPTLIGTHQFGPGKFIAPIMNHENKRVIVSSNLYYFEVSFDKIDNPMEYIFAIGLCPKNYKKSEFLGWRSKSIAYHSDDGHYFYNSGSGKKYAANYGQGDTVGCGFDVQKKVVFFTLNGKKLKDVLVNEDRFYPAISLKTYKKFTINFGGLPFKYNAYGELNDDDQSSSESDAMSAFAKEIIQVLRDGIESLASHSNESSNESDISLSMDDEDEDDEDDDDDDDDEDEYDDSEEDDDSDDDRGGDNNNNNNGNDSDFINKYKQLFNGTNLA
ncbi:B30.2/SPRY domain-containing protein [Entamoeba marina]